VALALWLAALLAGCAGTTPGGVTGPTSGAAPGTPRGLSIMTIAPGGAKEQIPATLAKPDGPGPFPAVVIMHDCSGLGPTSSGSPGRWAAELVGRGYVVVIPDSFTTRGHVRGVCTNPAPSRMDVSPARRVADAYAALAYVRTLREVDGRRVGLMGGSHGGSTTLASMAAPAAQRPGFAAAVALYPRCAMRMGSWRANLTGVYHPTAPLLILIGEKDDWTPAEPCRRLTDVARRAGHPVTIKTYPGAHHSFDSDRPVRYVGARINPAVPGGRGATTGGDPDAWADSIREVVAFFGQHLR
jgi:dienelactone hydrolase